ncbi:helix-turn-helix domain-containing protein [Streptomyces sp. NEAU-Y11]|uniref:helix-turn-helix domain-containing protein n=1 Tax=Streptomyces cucumeris TaxID=2962890 RepID=UPI0020C87A89|nr:helix-turn-helix transcriptional regulator [Streptomyces sp. NEAU-Y11]MCP9205484.1 helix-turn-helix domain-containing protein [Streptomyces sp. NEAU-Y11]
MPEHADIGSRLRDIRKRRGLTQRELAAASKVSTSLIRKLEQGEVETTRLETARRLAAALHVPTTRLVDRGDAPGDLQSGTDRSDLWTPVRRAIERPPARQAGEAPTVDDVRRAAHEVQVARKANKYTDVAALLPGLLREADALDRADAEARDTQAHVLLLAGSTLTQNRQWDAADVALSRALDVAEDRHLSAYAVSTQCWLLLRQGKLTAARELATRWADDLEPRWSRATSADLGTWGRLLTKLAASAVRDNRPGEAQDALKLARSAAVVTGRELPSAGDMAMWGPVTVAYIRAETHAIQDEPEQVLKIAGGLPVPGRRDPRRQLAAYNRHRLDVASAHVSLRQHGEAVEILTELHKAVPQWLPCQRYARDIMADVIDRRRTLTPEMRTLADAVGLPL